MLFDLFDQMRYQQRRTITPAALFDERLSLIGEAEILGFNTLWLSEHHSVPTHPLSVPNLLIAAAARITQTLRFGVMTTVLPFHHPARVAEESALLDHLTHGRFELGVGRGIAKKEFDAWALPMAESRDMFHESLDLLQELFSGEPVTHQGRYWELEGFSMMPGSFVQEPHCPVWMSSVSPTSMAEAARRNMPAITTFKSLSEERKFAHLYSSTWEERHTGVRPPIGTMKPVVVAGSDEEAWAIIKGPIQDFLHHFVQYGVPSPDEYAHVRNLRDSYDPEVYRTLVDRLEASTFEQLISEALVIAGSPETCVRQLKELEDAGYERFVCWSTFGEMPIDVARRSLALFAAEVMPSFATVRS